MTKTPPHNLAAEKAVLGAMLLSEEAAATVAAQLEVEDFYKPSHSVLYAHIISLFTERQKCDVLTLAESLKKSGELDEVGGAAELISIQAATPSISNVGSHAKIVADLAAQRKLILVGHEIQKMGFEGSSNVTALLNEAKQSVLDINSNAVEKSSQETGVVLGETIESMADAWLMPEGIVGIKTGFVDVDKKLSGMRRGTMTVVGARPAMGKSALAVNIASNVAIDEGLPVLFFSLEMTRDEVFARILSARSRVRLGAPDDTYEAALSNTDWIKIKNASIEIANSTIIVDDQTSITPVDLLSRSLEAQSKYGQLGLIVVDYIQLMTSSRPETRQMEISDISRNLKILAKDLSVPVLALSQLSRGVDSRPDHKPILSDLRESGSIEQDADVVAFLFREELYNEETIEKGVAEFIVAKHRNGRPGTVKLAYIGQQTRFASLAHST